MKTSDIAQALWGLAKKYPYPVHQENLMIRTAAQRLTELQDCIPMRDLATVLAEFARPPYVREGTPPEELVAEWMRLLRRMQEARNGQA